MLSGQEIHEPKLWRRLNQMGEVLMEVRSTLQVEQRHAAEERWWRQNRN
jgi:hypothetical protein